MRQPHPRAMLKPVDLYADPDESNAQALRRQLARELDIPESALAKTRIARPARFITTEREATSEPLHPSDSQYLVGKYLEVVFTVEGRGFEIAEYTSHGGWDTPITPARRTDGALRFDEGAVLLQVLSPDNRAVVVDALVRRLSRNRRSRWHRCRACRAMTPPEAFYQDNVCVGCTYDVFGILF